MHRLKLMWLTFIHANVLEIIIKSRHSEGYSFVIEPNT